jgi:hypothetical protein
MEWVKEKNLGSCMRSRLELVDDEFEDRGND